jgi:hypothetical protein
MNTPQQNMERRVDYFVFYENDPDIVKVIYETGDHQMYRYDGGVWRLIPDEEGE